MNHQINWNDITFYDRVIIFITKSGEHVMANFKGELEKLPYLWSLFNIDTVLFEY